MSLIFSVNGEAVGKERPKFVSQGKFVRVYTPKKTVDYENKIKKAFKKKYPSHKPISKDVPLKINVIVYRGITKSWSKKKKESAYNSEIFPTGKADVDNYLKSIMDALNGVAYEDDASIVSATISKVYIKKDEEPCVVINITTQKGGEKDVEDK